MSAETVDPQLPHALAKTILSLTPSRDPRAGPPVMHESERYEDRGLLGAGGMGEVRLGRDDRIGREVAIKVMRFGSGADAEARMRFVREARVQGQLEHPSIVPVYDLSINERGDAYFTMKRVRGMTLEEILERLRAADSAMASKYSRRRLLTAFSSVCLSVDFAHSRGVLHRDIKPSNVMLGDFGEVYLLDWGIAKVMGTPQSEREGTPPLSAPSTPTATGAVLGTIGYMAPEQLRGKELDPRADVYALGAVLFEILSLERLHPGGTADSIAKATLDGVDARLTARAPARDVPPELEAICVRATALRPEVRFQSARDLSEAVERFLDGDRDLEARRTKAESHARAAESILAGGDASFEARRAAMQEVGRALAFETTHERARKILVTLLGTVPRELPAEAAAEVDAARTRQERVGARLGAATYLCWLAGGAVLLWMGVRDWLAFGLFVAAQAFAAGACALRAWSTRSGRLPFVLLRVAMPLATLTLCTVFGPLIVAPTVAMAVTMSLLLHPSRRSHGAVLAFGCLSVALPAVLQQAGVIPRSYEFVGGTMLVRPWMTELPESATLLVLLAASLATILVSSIVLVRIRVELTDAERRLSSYAWHLRQLVPT